MKKKLSTHASANFLLNLISWSSFLSSFLTGTVDGVNFFSRSCEHRVEFVEFVIRLCMRARARGGHTRRRGEEQWCSKNCILPGIVFRVPANRQEPAESWLSCGSKTNKSLLLRLAAVRRRARSCRFFSEIQLYKASPRKVTSSAEKARSGRKLRRFAVPLRFSALSDV